MNSTASLVDSAASPVQSRCSASPEPSRRALEAAVASAAALYRRAGAKKLAFRILYTGLKRRLIRKYRLPHNPRPGDLAALGEAAGLDAEAGACNQGARTRSGKQQVARPLLGKGAGCASVAKCSDRKLAGVVDRSLTVKHKRTDRADSVRCNERAAV